MNILYHTYEKVHSTKGGTERTTITMASSLKSLYGARCFSIYEAAANTPKEDCFEKEFFWTPHKKLDKNSQVLRDIITANCIDCVIVQGAFIHVPRFRVALHGISCKLIIAHHFEPRWELTFVSFAKTIKYRPKSLSDFFRWMKSIIIYPLKSMIKEQQLSTAYRAAYDCADNVVLLSQYFVKPYAEFARLKHISKFIVIPNGLSFDVKTNFDNLSKQKMVLIVARLDESSKRLSLALRIWARVKQDSLSKDWTLCIIGHGSDRRLYEKIIKSGNIEDVSLLGRQDPFPFYEKASIFMMTSRSESWGLTLTEAQQMGVVPVTFDTYASLNEIIKNGVDGVVVNEGDVEGYVNRLKELMSNTNLRNMMARKAISTSQRFSSKSIAKKWWDLLNYNSSLGKSIER